VEQTARSLQGIVLSMSWVPCAMLVLAALAMGAYPLNDALMVKIEADLKGRRGVIES
jgi:Na+/melibiose symporter-like transporter